MAYKYKFGDFTYRFSDIDTNPTSRKHLNIYVEDSKSPFGRRMLFLKIAKEVSINGVIKVNSAHTKFDLTKEKSENDNNRLVQIPASKITKELRDAILKSFKKKYAQYIAKPMTAKAKKEALKKYTKAEIEKAKKRGEKMLKSAKKK